MPLLASMLLRQPGILLNFNCICLLTTLPRTSSYLTKRFLSSRQRGKLAVALPTEESCVTGYVNEEFLLKLKEYRKNKSPKKLHEHILALNSQQGLDLNMTYQAVRTLQRMNRTDLALSLLPIGQTLIPSGQYTSSDISIGVSFVRLCCKDGDMEGAMSISRKFNIDLNIPETITHELNMAYEALLPELALGFVSKKSFQTCLEVLELLCRLELKLSGDISKNILKGFVRGEGSMNIRKALRFLSKISHGPSTDIDLIQILCSHYLRTLDFVKGAVSMSTLPPEKCPEVCFIGRSNVRNIYYIYYI